MSNPLAVPAVTASLVTLVQAAVDTVGLTPGPVVSAGTLADSGDHGRVSVHLYRVSRHDSLSNETLPVRARLGGLRARPTIALDLHYLLCFRGDSELDAQSMLAVAAVTLEANPCLDPGLLALTEADHAEVVGNDLRDSPVRVRWTSDMLSVDELTRLWSLYQVGEFALSLAVSAGPVLVEAAAVPSENLPVGSIGLGARPFSPLRLDAVGGPDGPGAPVRAAAAAPAIELFGAGFRPSGTTTVVVLDGVEVAPTAVDDAHITVPGDGLMPGIHRVQVRTYGPPLDPDVSMTPTTATSRTRALQVVPTLSAATPGAGNVVTATVQPAVSSGQRVRLLMDPTAGGAAATVAADPLPAGGTTLVEFDVTDVDAGTYRLTLEVDGVRSIPELDAQGHYVNLVVTL